MYFLPNDLLKSYIQFVYKNIIYIIIQCSRRSHTHIRTKNNVILFCSMITDFSYLFVFDLVRPFSLLNPTLYKP